MQLTGKLVVVGAAVLVVAVLLGMWLWNMFGIMSAPIDILLPLIGVRLGRPLLDAHGL